MNIHCLLREKTMRARVGWGWKLGSWGKIDVPAQGPYGKRVLDVGQFPPCPTVFPFASSCLSCSTAPCSHPEYHQQILAHAIQTVRSGRAEKTTVNGKANLRKFLFWILSPLLHKGECGKARNMSDPAAREECRSPMCVLVRNTLHKSGMYLTLVCDQSTGWARKAVVYVPCVKSCA